MKIKNSDILSAASFLATGVGIAIKFFIDKGEKDRTNDLIIEKVNEIIEDRMKKKSVS